MIEAIHYELECALGDPAAEVERLLDMQKLTYSPLSSICAQCLEEGRADLNSFPCAGCLSWSVQLCSTCFQAGSHAPAGHQHALDNHSADSTIATVSSAPQGPLPWSVCA